MLPTLARPRILVVEDDPDARLLLHHLLERRFHVQIEATVTAGITAAADELFDAVILDINLGEEKTGLDLLRDIRTMKSYRTVPALALTAYALPGDEDHYLGSGFDGYISKPFSRDSLYTALDGVLQRAASSGAGRSASGSRSRVASLLAGRRWER